MTDRAYREAFPERRRAKEARRRALKRNADGSGWTETDVAEVFELQRGRCAICGKRLGKDFHRDHIVPLVRGGAHDRKNLQLTHPKCNHQKWMHDPIEFAQQRGLLL